MRRVTVRFGESLWSLIEDECNRDGVSAAQWIRDAALARALWERQRRGLHAGLDALDAVRGEYVLEDQRSAQVIEDVQAHAFAELRALLEKLPPESAEIIRRWYKL